MMPAASFAQDVTIPIIVKDTTSFYWQIVLAGARQAGKDLGVSVPELGAQSESDINGQISILENAVAGAPAAEGNRRGNARIHRRADAQLDRTPRFRSARPGALAGRHLPYRSAQRTGPRRLRLNTGLNLSDEKKATFEVAFLFQLPALRAA